MNDSDLLRYYPKELLLDPTKASNVSKSELTTTLSGILVESSTSVEEIVRKVFSEISVLDIRDTELIIDHIQGVNAQTSIDSRNYRQMRNLSINIDFVDGIKVLHLSWGTESLDHGLAKELGLEQSLLYVGSKHYLCAAIGSYYKLNIEAMVAGTCIEGQVKVALKSWVPQCHDGHNLELPGPSNEQLIDVGDGYKCKFTGFQIYDGYDMLRSVPPMKNGTLIYYFAGIPYLEIGLKPQNSPVVDTETKITLYEAAFSLRRQIDANLSRPK